MKSSLLTYRPRLALARKLALGFVLLPLIAFSISPASAQRDDSRDARHGNDNERAREDRGNAQHRGASERYDRQDDNDRYRRGGYQSERRRGYSYAQPVYVPPTVYREPRQSPGISLFLPLDFRR
jgi:hypothetical protein